MNYASVLEQGKICSYPRTVARLHWKQVKANARDGMASACVVSQSVAEGTHCSAAHAEPLINCIVQMSRSCSPTPRFADDSQTCIAAASLTIAWNGDPPPHTMARVRRTTLLFIELE